MNKKGLKFFLWIFLFPIMIWYIIFKTGKIKKKPKIVILSVYSLILVSLFNSSYGSNSNPEDNLSVIIEDNQSEEIIASTEDQISNIEVKTDKSIEKVDNELEEEKNDSSFNLIDVSDGKENSDIQTTENKNSDEEMLFEGYRLIEVDGGNLSGNREPNVVVDIGYGDRKYFAFTNEYGQLVKVIADEIILQDDSTEPVLESGRYYSDEAKVPGVESSTLDEGHVIADSLGGVSNAYNITPEESTLNRYGDQAYMEKVIRDAGGCSNFEAIITYPDTKTMIPSHYGFTYILMGSAINDEFDNVNPDEVNKAAIIETTETPKVSITIDADLQTVTNQIQPTTSSAEDELIKIDTNGNGKVTIAEAKAAGFKMPIYSDNWLYKYMDDRDGDGMVGE